MKLSLFKPSDGTLLSLIQKYGYDGFTYQSVGSTESWPTSVFAKLPISEVVDGDLLQYRRVSIGSGLHDYRLGMQAIRQAVCFDLPWLDCHRDGDFKVGDTFSLTARAFGVWASNFCKVVYMEEQESVANRMFSLGLGTLPWHAATGEERFSIFWDYETDEVDFLIGSFSRPQTLLARLFARYLRKQQNRFATESSSRVRQEVESSCNREMAKPN